MVKIERVKYIDPRFQKVFFISENEDNENPPEITVHCYIPQEGNKNFTLKLLESGVYFFNFHFKYCGKYVFIFFENEIRKLIMVTTIV